MTGKPMPGPGFFETLSVGRRSRRSYVEPIEEMYTKYGDYVEFMGLRKAVCVFHPDGVEYVLKTNQKNYTKADDMKQLRPVLGNGLLTSEGEEWRTNRRLVAPEFQHKNLLHFFDVMVRHMEIMVREWRQFSGTVNLCPHISKTTYRIAGECFFGTDLEATSKVIYDGIETTSEIAVKRMIGIVHPDYKWPLPSHRRMWKSVAAMDKVVFDIIDERLKHPREGEDVLSRLIKAGDLSRTQMRDEVMTLLLAGHETTANALSWTLLLLGRNPKIQDKVRDEVSAVMGGEVPTAAEVARMPFTKMVLEESMRVYPPVGGFGRQNVADDVIGGYRVKAKSKVNLVPWVTHCHPEFWDKPDEFIPERFADPSKHHPWAYFPFGGGARECVGKNMAMMEGTGLLAAMIRNFRFHLQNDAVKPRPLITIRPDPGIFMRVEPVIGKSFRERSLTH